MDLGQGKYNMKAVSKLLGIQPGTLRAWERRYKIIAPERNESGHRLYTERHITILRWLIKKVDEGFTISQAVSLYEESEAKKNVNYDAQTEKLDYTFHEIKLNLLQALINFEEDRALRVWDYAFCLFSVEFALVNLLKTLLDEMNRLLEENKISSVHERYIISFIRSKIGAVLQTMPSDPHWPNAVAVCGPNEYQELDLLMFSIFLKCRGYKVIYLGTGVRDEDLYAALNELQPKLLFISFTTIKTEEAIHFISTITEQYHDLHIGIVGEAIPCLKKELDEKYQKYVVGQNKTEWDEWIKQNACLHPH
ncbi:MAG TPA: MerR family transcriptional regulator [Bacillales bacterium]|nr:MerR family transcriptional regulator [Bacillales bacterium]